jgi:hypothetical protein
MSTQDLILDHLLYKGPITPAIALKKYGCFRLASAIHRLRKDYNIKTENVIENGKTYGKYIFEDKQNGQMEQIT